MGDAVGKGGQKTPKATKVQARYANQLFEDTDPIRQSLFGRSEDFLAGGFDPRETPTYEALKLATDSGFNQAKDNLIARFAPGGGLIDAMTGLESSRASTLSRGAASVYDDELQRAMVLGSGFTAQSLGALGSAGNIQAQIAQANAGLNAASKSAFGEALGGK